MKIKRKLLSMLLAVFLMLGPTTSVVFAETSTSYNLWVGGVEVTSANASCITGDGITGTVSYDPTSKTLTLNNVRITGGHSFENGMGTDTAGIYYTGNDWNGSLKIKLIGTNEICGTLGNSDISSYGIFNDSFWWEPTFEGDGSLTIAAANGKADHDNSWSVGIYSKNNIVVGSNCTITVTSGTATSIAAAIYIGYANSKLKATNSKVTAGDSATSSTVVDIASDDFDPNGYKYMKIEPGPVQSVTAINVTDVPVPVVGQHPYYASPTFSSTPANAVNIADNTAYRWLKIAKDKYTGSSNDVWSVMTSGDTFMEGYYYSYSIDFTAKDGYKIPTSVTGQINGSECKVIGTDESRPITLKKVFDNLVEITVTKYAITSGVNQEITADQSATFVSDASFDKFLKVQVDGIDVAASNYTAEKGSTKITLKKEFIKGLSLGEHSITIVSEDGYATTKFVVKAIVNDSGENNSNSSENKTNTGVQSPQTGDTNNMTLWLGALFVSGLGVITTTVYNKKKKHNSEI